MIKKRTSATDPVDVQELVTIIDHAAAMCATASQDSRNACLLFQAIVAASPEGCLAVRLALFGERLCEERDDVFQGYQAELEQHVDRFSNTLSVRAEVSDA